MYSGLPQLWLTDQSLNFDAERFKMEYQWPKIFVGHPRSKFEQHSSCVCIF